MIYSKDDILSILNEIYDPEIPVISIVDLGMIKDIVIREDNVIIELMPTYMSCPATHQIKSDVERKLRENNINAKVEIVYTPAWTTARMSERSFEKLKKHGISPPQGNVSVHELMNGKYCIECPRCGSTNTKLKSAFGSTPCKALFQCNDCKEVFDYFKCHL